MTTLDPIATVSRDQDLHYARQLVRSGGPATGDVATFDAWLDRLYRERCAGQLPDHELDAIRGELMSVLSTDSMTGFAWRKPHGYAGDFEVIDRMYTLHAAKDPRLECWDRYWHGSAAATAVRNRKSYYKSLLDLHYARRGSLRLLDVASGSGRALFEWLCENPDADVRFDCLEQDPNAIAYASRLNARFGDRIRFTQGNALRWRAAGSYDLVWSAGLFDYLSDRVFVALLGRLLAAVAPGGEVVVGNFSEENPTRPYMEILIDWMLHHRSPASLRSLARQCGAGDGRITVGCEPGGVNLFLYVGSV